MAGQPYWEDIDGADAWDFPIIGGEVMPGICVVKTNVKRDVKLKKSKAKSGESLEDQGNKAATGTITMQLASRPQWDEWQRILPVIQPRRADGIKDPLEIVHPEPNSKNVTQIFIDEIPGYSPPAKGILTVTMRFKEFVPKPKKVRTGGSAGSGTGGKKKGSKRGKKTAKKKSKTAKHGMKEAYFGRNVSPAKVFI